MRKNSYTSQKLDKGAQIQLKQFESSAIKQQTTILSWLQTSTRKFTEGISDLQQQ